MQGLNSCLIVRYFPFDDFLKIEVVTIIPTSQMRKLRLWEIKSLHPATKCPLEPEFLDMSPQVQ